MCGAGYPHRIFVLHCRGAEEGQDKSYAKKSKIDEELLQGIRVIKSYAWETPLEKVEKVHAELRNLGIMLFFSAVSLSVAFITPVAVGLASTCTRPKEIIDSFYSLHHICSDQLAMAACADSHGNCTLRGGSGPLQEINKIHVFGRTAEESILLTDKGSSSDYSLTMIDSIFAWSPEKAHFS